MEHFCKRCIAFSETENLKETLERYIDSLNEEIKVSPKQYKQRLMICDGCEYMIQGMCKYCGCFVIVRAWKKGLSCPCPQNDKWKKDEDFL
jgi:hypothetical protein